MFLSVSIPVYNAEKYLDRCIESIITQTFTDFELILVDDGSTDNSVNICRKWEKQYPLKVRTIEKKNEGSLLTRRVCLKESSGDFLYIMDADDYLLSKAAFSTIVSYLQCSDSDICIFNATTKKDSTRYYAYGFKDKEIFEGEHLREIYRVLAEGDLLNSLWNKVFSRRLIDWDYDYLNVTEVTNGTDMFQVIPIILDAKKIIYCDKVLYFYQTQNNAESIMHKFRPSIFSALKANYIRLYQELDRHDLLNKELKKILSTRFMLITSTSAHKIIQLGKDKSFDSIGYLEMIGEDEIFRNNYPYFDKKKLSAARLIIVKLLYMRQYRLLNFLLRNVVNR